MDKVNGTAPSDALVLFGVTGDLAYKQIFPALYAMVKRGVLTVPVIGVAALAHGASRQLRKRVTQSIRHSGAVVSPRPLRVLLSLLQYVSGDYNDPETFQALKRALGKAHRPAHYLAIPPALFETVIHGSRQRGADEECPRHRREAIRARSRLGARAQCRGTHGISRGLHLPDRSLSGEGGDHEHPLLSFRELLSRAHLESQLRVERPDHAGRRVRRERSRRVSTKARAAFAT